MDIKKLTSEYNSDVIGYIVRDETGRSINFQFDKCVSNHPTPDFVLKCACEGDETYKNFSEDERFEIRQWLRSKEDVLQKEKSFTEHFYEHKNENPWSSPCDNEDCIF